MTSCSESATWRGFFIERTPATHGHAGRRGALVHKHLIVLAWRHAVVMSGKHGIYLVNQAKIANGLQVIAVVLFGCRRLRRERVQLGAAAALIGDRMADTPTRDP